VADLTFGHGIGDFTLTGALKHVTRYKGSSTDTTAWLGGYTRFDLGLAYQFRLAGAPSRVTLYGRNLSDKRYETSNGVQDAGRSLGVEFTTSF
jgi:outer membrane receptor protein involved in Fe transport